jgi:selenocysteine lyase/cysteine desulfurase
MTDQGSVTGLSAIQAEIRRRFPHLDRDAFGNPRLHLNCGAGTLMVDTAIEAMAGAGSTLNSLPGDVTPAERATRDLHARTRETVAAFLNAREAGEVSFHVSSTGALFNLAFALAPLLDRRTNLVVTDLDHMANISPWERVGGEGLGCEVRRCGIDDEGLVAPERLAGLCDERTGVVALTMASNGLGTIAPLAELIPLVRARAPRALVVVDAVHHALHGPLDVRAIDCDALVFSGYKVFGSMIGALWVRGAVADRLRPYRVETNKDIAPAKFEQGSLNNASVASLLAALEYLAWIGRRLAGDGPAAGGPDLRTRLLTAMRAVSAHDRGLSVEVLRGFERLDPGRFRCYGIIDPARAGERDPTFAFEVRGLAPDEIKRRLWSGYGLQVADGNHYSAAVVRHLGRASICRASFCHYHTADEARKFVSALQDLVSSGPGP